MFKHSHTKMRLAITLAIFIDFFQKSINFYNFKRKKMSTIASSKEFLSSFMEPMKREFFHSLQRPHGCYRMNKNKIIDLI